MLLASCAYANGKATLAVIDARASAKQVIIPNLRALYFLIKCKSNKEYFTVPTLYAMPSVHKIEFNPLFNRSLSGDEPPKATVVVSDATSLLNLGHDVTLLLNVEGVLLLPLSPCFCSLQSFRYLLTVLAAEV